MDLCTLLSSLFDHYIFAFSGLNVALCQNKNARVLCVCRDGWRDPKGLILEQHY